MRADSAVALHAGVRVSLRVGPPAGGCVHWDGQPQGAQPCAAVHAQRLNATALEPPPWLRGHIHTTQLKRHSMMAGNPDDMGGGTARGMPLGA